MALSEGTKRELLLAIVSMLFIVFVTGIGSDSQGVEEEPIVIP